LPGLYLLSHGLEVPLHLVDAYRNAIDQQKGLRVFGQHRREHAVDNVSNSTNVAFREGDFALQIWVR